MLTRYNPSESVWAGTYANTVCLLCKHWKGGAKTRVIYSARTMGRRADKVQMKPHSVDGSTYYATNQSLTKICTYKVHFSAKQTCAILG